MAYQTPLTIKEALEKIASDEYVLPAIQREFVWDQDQIVRLFDSLMRDYPISTFLLWEVKKENVKEFQFYRFLRDYHQRDLRHNEKFFPDGSQKLTAVLDGQQRMTSLYVALYGTYTVKLPYYSWDSEKAFPKKRMYLNLLSESEDPELLYDFQFLSDDEVENDETHHWFLANEILDLKVEDVALYLMDKGLFDPAKYGDATKFALGVLTRFRKVIQEDGAISYFEEKSTELDKVLQIFIRINSGGTKLSYSDLLLSIATAQWEERDAREVIHNFVDEINTIGGGFNFNKDFVLKACLVLADFKDIKFKVDNFTRENMIFIEKHWDQISFAIKQTIKLIAKFGYSKDNLLSTTSIIPIAYFVYKNDIGKNIIHYQVQHQNRKNIKEWLARVSLKGTFGGQPDSIYPTMRNLVNNHPREFNLQAIIDHYKGSRKSISFSEDDLDSIMNLSYGKARTYCALTLLYPGLNYSFKYHQDHIFPRTFFSPKKLAELGIVDSETQKSYIERVNKLPNLQFLEATQNLEKSSSLFKEWILKQRPESRERKLFLDQHFIHVDQSLEMKDFLAFYAARHEVLKQRFAAILNVNLQEGEENTPVQ